jgi:predicted Zn-dependent protease
MQTLASVQEALARDDLEEVLRLTDAILAERPGDDAAHELRARALLGLRRFDEAEAHVNDAVRLDPDEIRYRELLAEVLAAEGAHRDAAVEYARLSRGDPRQQAWTLAEAEERLDADQASQAADAARRAVRLDPADAEAQLTLARALLRQGEPVGALRAATATAELRPGDLAARETLADARWLADRDAAAFTEFGALARQLSGADRERVLAKARSLYAQHAGFWGRVALAVPGLFAFALGRGWLDVK